MDKYYVKISFGTTIRAKNKIDAIHLAELTLDRITKKKSFKTSKYCEGFTVNKVE